MKRTILLSIAAICWLGACGQMMAGTVTLQLLPSANQSAPLGGTMTWTLQVENDDPEKYLQLDNVSWDVAIAITQAVDDGFANFTFPVLAPQTGLTPTLEIVPLLSVTWLPTGVPNFSTQGYVIVSSSWCNDDVGGGCVANSDVSLPISLSVASDAVPEPVSLVLVGAGLVGLIGVRRGFPWRKAR